MSQMLPEGAEVMRRVACGDVCPAPPPPAPAPLTNNTIRSENKELLRQQLLSASKERLAADRTEPPKQKHPRARQKNRWKLKFHHQALPQEYLDHYERSLQKAGAKRKAKPEGRKPDAAADAALPDDAFELWARRLAALQREAAPAPAPRPDAKGKPPAIAPSRIVTYDDLPYMGEMTLDESKPRRGRKPKKADICHLIYENYGTVVPGRPPADAPAAPAPRTDLQNRIISSLLERKLCLGRPPGPVPAAPRTRAGPLHSDDEPLNLCVRDLRDLRIQIRRKFGDIYPDAVKREPEQPEQPNAISVIRRAARPPGAASSSPDAVRRRAPSPALSEPARAPSPAAPLAWWPPAAVCLHPLALHTQLLYYQRLAAAGASPADAPADRTPVGTPSATPPGAPERSPGAPSPAEGGGKLVLKRMSELLEPRASGDAGAKRASPRPGAAPAKRKRSALFVPPAVARGAGARGGAAEVSICKFKFTGGARPSLQEKKMLSVDAGGNFRFYSGAGKGRPAEGAPPPAPAPAPRRAPDEEADKKKRKSRKSVQRERLERTFKEKGFLIQTQQLQSAEGATYCKFRQLRKFTRYLFRSWKDYLPGELDERPGAAPDALAEGPTPPEGDPVAAGEWG